MYCFGIFLFVDVNLHSGFLVTVILIFVELLCMFHTGKIRLFSAEFLPLDFKKLDYMYQLVNTPAIR